MERPFRVHRSGRSRLPLSYIRDDGSLGSAITRSPLFAVDHVGVTNLRCSKSS